MRHCALILYEGLLCKLFVVFIVFGMCHEKMTKWLAFGRTRIEPVFGATEDFSSHSLCCVI